MPRRSYGEGSIYERTRRGKTYFVATLSVTQYGKRRRREVWCADRTAARKALAKLKTDRAKGRRIFSDRMQIGDWLDQWLEERKASVAPSTAMSYERVVRRYIAPAIGKLRLDACAPATIAGFYEDLRRSKVSSATIRRVHVILHKAFADAVRREVIDRNPAAIVEKPRHRYREVEPYSIEEMRRFLTVASTDALEALWIVALFSQAREGELLALQWGDVNLEAGTIYVRRGLQDVTHSVRRIAEPKTPTSRRPIDLPAIAIEALLRQRARTPAKARDLVFPDRLGQPLRRHNILRRHLYPLMERARRCIKCGATWARVGGSTNTCHACGGGSEGLRRITFHGLRHSGATLLAERVPLVVLKERLGHASITTTANVYVHRSPSMGRIAADSLDALFPSTDPPTKPEDEPVKVQPD